MIINIIGAGRVGKTFGRLFSERSIFEIGSVYSRTFNAAKSACAFIGSGTPVSDLSRISRADIYMISTSDNAIASISKELASTHRPNEGSIIFHCSGVAPSSTLDQFKKLDCYTASLHPIKSFADPSIAITNFEGTYCSMEGDESALSVIAESIHALGGYTFTIQSDKKAIYHAATAMACNHMVGLIESAITMYMAAGIDRKNVLKIMAPIVQGTLINIFNLDTTNALTGPIVRGDTDTIHAHLCAIESDDLLTNTYATLGLWCLKLSKLRGEADKNNLEVIESQLNNAHFSSTTSPKINK